MGEVWKQISGYEGLYEVSSLGQIRSRDRRVRTSRGSGFAWRKGKVLSLCDNGKGYGMVSLCKEGKVKRHLVHRLVCIAFHGEPPLGYHACHNDGNAANNAASNLRWASAKSNEQDKRDHGTVNLGERNGMSVLTERQVREIRADTRPHSQIAMEYGTCTSNVSAIKRRVNWAHLP